MSYWCIRALSDGAPPYIYIVVFYCFRVLVVCIVLPMLSSLKAVVVYFTILLKFVDIFHFASDLERKI